MDPELIAFLNRRFDSLQQQMAQQGADLRTEMAEQAAGLRAEMAEQAAGLRAEMTQQIAALQEQMDRRFAGMEDTVRHTHILVEDLRHKLQILAEGYIGLNDKLDRYHNESTVAFEQVQGWIEPYYRILDGRLRVMESRAERQDGDVFEAVRRILGRPPLQTPQTSE